MLLATKHCAWTIDNRRRRREAPVSLSATDALDEDDKPAVVALDETPDPGERLERAELHRARLAQFARLKPDERTALLLFALGNSYREIAEGKGWTHTKVNRCIAEGRAALRRDI